MTTPSAPASSPLAIAAFLRGVGQRARLLATVQAGASRPAEQALAVVAQVFASEAGQWPIAQWPHQYWRLLLATPHLRQLGTPDPEALCLPGIARLPLLQRTAILLQLVAGLDDTTAAIALGTSVSAYQQAIRDGLPRDVLGQPDLDVWRAWRAAVQRELAQGGPAVGTVLPESRQAVARSPAKHTPAAGKLAGTAISDATPRQHVRWLWLGVGICILAFATTFFLHPAGRAVLQRWTARIKIEPLPAASAPKARFNAGDVEAIADRELLAAPEEVAHAGQLDLLSWLAVKSEDSRAADAVALPVTVAPALRTAMDSARASTAMAVRVHHWEALPARVRGMRRAQWQAWRSLTAGERIRLRGIAPRWHALVSVQQQALRARFDAQSPDARSGWRLGPTLGRDWLRINALFAYVDAGQRDALLELLRETDRDEWEVLARLAQTTPPEQRARLRGALLAQAPSQRGDWLRAQLAR